MDNNYNLLMGKNNNANTIHGINIPSEFIMFLMIAFIGISLSLLFEADIILPLHISLGLLAVIVIWGIFGIRFSKLSLLSRIMIIFYSLPFIHGLEYIFISDISNQNILWGLPVNDYQVDFEIVNKMFMAGCIGAYGLVAGYGFVKTIKDKGDVDYIRSNSLKLTGFIVVSMISLAFSWISAPQETILKAAYTESLSMLDNESINFGAGWMVSHTLAMLLLVDTLNETNVKRKRIKTGITLAVALIIIVWFQLLRGDREFMGMAAGYFSFYLIYNSSNIKRMFEKSKKYLKTKKNKLNKYFVLVIIVLVIVSSQLLGSLRSQLSNLESPTEIVKLSKFEGLHGTWSAVLLTPLSVVGDFHNNLMKPRWGETYVDYTMSMIPGVVAQNLGIERPLESTKGPAWEMRYGLGGTHAMVVPFMNFKTPGVFFILLLFGIFIAACEKNIKYLFRVKNSLFYGSMFVLAPFWFWYGDMYLIRGIMSFYIVLFLYIVLPKYKLQNQC